MSNTLITPYGAGAMRAHDAAKFLGVAVSTFWRWVKEGRLPKGRRLSSRCTVWLRADIERFLRKAGRRSPCPEYKKTLLADRTFRPPIPAALAPTLPWSSSTAPSFGICVGDPACGSIAAA